MLSYEKINFSAFCIREEKFEKNEKKKIKNTMKNPKNQVGKMSEIFQREKRQNFDICPRRTVPFLAQKSNLVNLYTRNLNFKTKS